MKSRNRNPIAQAATLEKAREAAFDLIEARADAVADAITEQLSARKLAEYDRAAKQAEALLAEADPDNPAGTYGALSADVAAGTIDPRDGQPVATLKQAAEVIMLTRAPWEAALDAQRQARLTAKNAVRAAASAEEVEQILAGIVWPAV